MPASDGRVRSGLWRRACLRSRDDVIALAALWAAVIAGVVLVVAGTRAWPNGLAAGVGVAVLAYLPYRWRRRRWDAVVRRSADDGLVRLERLLDEHRPPERPAES